MNDQNLELDDAPVQYRWNEIVSALRTSDGAGRSTFVGSYYSLSELRSAILRLDVDENWTVVLILDKAFAGILSAVIKRPRGFPEGRLVLVAESGRLPGFETIGDLSGSAAALGWQEILLERELPSALEGVQQTMRPNERLHLFTPSWHVCN